MEPQLREAADSMGFLWSSLYFQNTEGCDGLIHHGARHCLLEFIRKLMDTGKVGAKYYVLFHTFPLLLKLKKTKNLQDLVRVVREVGLNYLKSVLFMAFLVGLLRGGLCFNEHILVLHPFYNFILDGIVSSSSILFEDASRRSEITYYVCAKALRSVYLGLKRTLHLTSLKDESTWMHICLMSTLYYLYNHQPKMLKYHNYFEFILGN